MASSTSFSLGREWTEVRPAQAEIEREVRFYFEIVLSKKAPDIFALVLANCRRDPSIRIDLHKFALRRIVEKVPHIVEVVGWHAAAGTVLQIIEARAVTPKLNGVASVNLGGHVLDAVRPLIQDAADIRSKGFYVRVAAEAANLKNGVRRKSNRRLRVGRNLVPVPSGGIRAGFVEETRRDGVVPDCGECLIDLRVMEEVVLTGGTVQETA